MSPKKQFARGACCRLDDSETAGRRCSVDDSNGDPRGRDFFIEGSLFIVSIYFGATFAMSRYSQWLERRLKIDSAW